MNRELKHEFFSAMMGFRRLGMPTPPGEDIRMGELIVLGKIPEKGASLTEIQNNLFMTKSGVSQMLGDLQRRGLVRRETDPLDRRKITVTLTGEGKRFQERQRRYADRVMDLTISRFGEEEMTELIALLKRLSEVSAKIRQEIENQIDPFDPEGEIPLD